MYLCRSRTESLARQERRMGGRRWSRCRIKQRRGRENEGDGEVFTVTRKLKKEKHRDKPTTEDEAYAGPQRRRDLQLHLQALCRLSLIRQVARSTD